MKKTLSIVALTTLLGMPLLASADNGLHKGNIFSRTKIEFKHHKEHKDDDDRATSTQSNTIKLPMVTNANVTTYADVSTLLAGYASTTKSLRLSATTSASTTLSSGELALLAKLTPGATKAERVNASADALIAKINNLNSLVSPLGTTTITTEFGIKNLVVRELNRIVSSINALAKLSATIK